MYEYDPKFLSVKSLSLSYQQGRAVSARAFSLCQWSLRVVDTDMPWAMRSTWYPSPKWWFDRRLYTMIRQTMFVRVISHANTICPVTVSFPCSNPAPGTRWISSQRTCSGLQWFRSARKRTVMIFVGRTLTHLHNGFVSSLIGIHHPWLASRPICRSVTYPAWGFVSCDRLGFRPRAPGLRRSGEETQPTGLLTARSY